MPGPTSSRSAPWKTATLAGMASYLDAAALVTSGIAIGGYYAAPLRLSPETIGSLLDCRPWRSPPVRSSAAGWATAWAVARSSPSPSSCTRRASCCSSWPRAPPCCSRGS